MVNTVYQDNRVKHSRSSQSFVCSIHVVFFSWMEEGLCVKVLDRVKNFVIKIGKKLHLSNLTKTISEE